MTDAETLDLGELDFSEFEAFWGVFPRRRDRRRAEGAFMRARKLSSFKEIMCAARLYAAEVRGQPVERIRWPNEWLRAEPWLPDAVPIAPRSAPRRRARRDSSKPRRAPHRVTRIRLTVEEQKAKWCREHGITIAEYESRKDDVEWLERVKRRGVVA